MANCIRRAIAVTATILLTTALAAPTPARAGGFAFTYLDPTPNGMRAGTTYTIGMWILQHGNHPPSGGDMRDVGLRLIDAKGGQTAFRAMPLAEPAHYAAAVVLPHDGTFTVVAEQGWFGPYLVGSVTVPGALTQLPTSIPLEKKHLESYWLGMPQPPVLPVDEKRDPFTDKIPALVGALPPAPAATASAAPLAEVPKLASTEIEDGQTPWLPLLAGIAALTLVGAVLFGRRRLAAGHR